MNVFPALGKGSLLIKVAFLLVALLALLPGCDRPSPGRESAEPAPPSRDYGPPVDGGRLLQATLAEPMNLIPALSTDSASHAVAEHLYVAPLKYDKDIKLVPWAAESYEVLEDGRLLRFRLRPGIRWWDGVELTAKDVEFTYKLMIDPKTPTAYAEDYLAVKSFTVTGRYSFEVRYDKPFARALVTWALSILPEHALAGQDLMNTKYSREPLGCGAYKIKEWLPGSRLVLTANAEYFEGRPHLDEMVLRVIPDQATQFLELKAGNLDEMGLSPYQYLFETNGPEWKERFRKYEYLSFGYTYLGYNLDSPLFSDVRVRRALDFAIDKEEIVKGVLAGLGVPAVGPYKPGTWVYNESLKPRAHDSGRARALLAEAGWRDTDGDGLLDKGGRPFAFTILTNQGNTQRIQAATIIQRRLRDVGVEARIRTVEWAAFIKEFVNKGRFDALVLGWNITQDPDIYDVWHSSKAEPGGLNFVHYRNPELDELLEEGRRTLDQNRRKRIYGRVQEILHEDQPYCFLYVPMSLPILQARIQGVAPAPAGIDYNFYQWWIPRELQRPVLER
ncbi:MAG TPA: peptide-binding protein [Desulfovibrio sp.]|uniref:peptide-binding protein n=1 Tax=Desulfovibrio sp. TaxID=885 RepID=UPI002BB5D556|nr:peptide-binding protein [Desulfovibrio sp.]HMM37958.1 peptide-binding protein [Desulfovibrio sp.]